MVKVTVFDFETTGLSGKNDRIIEMAAIKYEVGKEPEKLHLLIDVGFPLSPEITAITGITDEELQSEGVNEKFALESLLKLMGDDLIVAHNAAFDLSFLHHSMMRQLGETFGNNFLDTCTIARHRHPYPHKLIDCCARYGIDFEEDDAHRALADVQATFELMKSMQHEQDIAEYINHIAYVRKYGAPAWLPAHAKAYPIDLFYN